MKYRYRLVAAVSVVLCFVCSIAGYKLCSAFYNHIMGKSEVDYFMVEPVKDAHSLQLRISIKPNQSAFMIRAISVKRHGSTITVLYHLSKPGLFNPALAWDSAYVLTVPDSVNEIRLGRDAVIIWHRIQHP